MAKHNRTRVKATAANPVGYYWVERGIGSYSPVIFFGKKELILEPRPERMFIEGEREALLFQLQQDAAERLFGIPQYVMGQEKGEDGETRQVPIRHPAWDEMPVLIDEADLPEPPPEEAGGSEPIPIRAGSKPEKKSNIIIP